MWFSQVYRSGRYCAKYSLEKFCARFLCSEMHLCNWFDVGGHLMSLVSSLYPRYEIRAEKWEDKAFMFVPCLADCNLARWVSQFSVYSIDSPDSPVHCSRCLSQTPTTQNCPQINYCILIVLIPAQLLDWSWLLDRMIFLPQELSPWSYNSPRRWINIFLQSSTLLMEYVVFWTSVLKIRNSTENNWRGVFASSEWSFIELRLSVFVGDFFIIMQGISTILDL